MEKLPNPSIDYSDIALIKIYKSEGENLMLAISFNKGGSNYYKFREENFSKKFDGERIDSHWDTDWDYDGASDTKSRNEIETLISWSEFHSQDSLPLAGWAD